MSADKPKALTIRDITERKKTSRKIVMVTAYDALFGRLVDEAEAWLCEAAVAQ